MARLVDFLTRHHGRLTLAILLSALLPAAFLPRLKINNSIEIWLPQDSAEFSRYRAFTSRYGSEEFVVVALEAEDALSPESLETQQRLAEGIGRIDGVDDVLALPQFSGLIRRSADGKAQLGDGGFLDNLLRSRDGKTAGIVVWLRRLEGASARRKTVEAIEQIAEAIAGSKAHFAGTPLMNVALDRESQRASMIFLPLAICASILVLAFMLRSFWGVLSVITAVGVTVVWTTGLVAMAGRTLNMVTVTIPSLMFALALSNGIHLASEYANNAAVLHDRLAALRRTLEDLTLPAFLTAITTAIGFGSLGISNMAPVMELGVFAGIGIMIGFVCTLVVVPGLLAFAARHFVAPGRRQPPHWTERTGPFVTRRPWTMMALSLVLLVLFSAGARKIKTESNVLKFFPTDSRIARDYAFVGARLTGCYTVELDIRTSKSGAQAIEPIIERMAKAIEQRPEVARVDHLGRVERFGVAATQGGVKITPASTLRFLKLRQRFVHDEGDARWLRVSVLVSAMESSRFYSLLESIRTEAGKALPPEAPFVLTGIVSLLNDAQGTLVRIQIYTFFLAAAVILAVIGLIFRSWRVMLVVIPSNLVPIMGTFALMGWRRIPLDAATVMIASIAIGIAIDNAVHFLSRYRHALRQSANPSEAVGAAFAKMGRAAVFTSVVAAVGFGVLALAQFRPIAEFGLLEGFTMITSLAGDLFLLPPSARLMRVWRNQ